MTSQSLSGAVVGHRRHRVWYRRPSQERSRVPSALSPMSHDKAHFYGRSSAVSIRHVSGVAIHHVTPMSMLEVTLEAVAHSYVSQVNGPSLRRMTFQLEVTRRQELGSSTTLHDIWPLELENQQSCHLLKHFMLG